MYTVSVKRDFIARHFLIGGDWERENEPHAHQYVAEIRMQSAELDQHGYLVDIVRIEAELGSMIDYFRDRLLNDLPEFKGLNPSIEHFSRIICQRLLAGIQPPGKGKIAVRLWENETCWAAWEQNY